MKASLRTVTPQTPDTVTLRFDLSLEFKPGQAVKILIPGDSKSRFFSISSSPSEPGYLEVTIKADAASGLMEILKNLQRGDTVEIEGPFGKFGLPDPVNAPLCFIAAGSGVTPFRAMVKYLLDTDATMDSWLLHSVKTQQDLIFQNEFSEWSGSRKNFHYVPTLTQDFDDNWDNETGRINETLIRKHIAGKPCTYLLCGPASFVGDMEKMLQDQLKVLPADIRREQW